jgi:hypothetical protein
VGTNEQTFRPCHFGREEVGQEPREKQVAARRRRYLAHGADAHELRGARGGSLIRTNYCADGEGQHLVSVKRQVSGAYTLPLFSST